MAGVDFKHAQGTVEMSPGQDSAEVKVGIIDDNEYEPDESFYCRLYKPSDGCVLGVFQITEVTIVNDDDPGQFSLEKESVVVSELAGKVSINVERKNGCDGNVQVRYSTLPLLGPSESTSATEAKGGDIEAPMSKRSAKGIATAERDYISTAGVLHFAHQETLKSFEIEIPNNNSYTKDKSFRVAIEILEFPQCGATYGPYKEAIVKIAHDEEMTKAVDKVAILLSQNLNLLRAGTDTWRKQFSDAITLYPEDGQEPSCMDFFMHFLTFGWKVMFALVPPTHYAGGWVTFWVSLIFIGALTGVVGDIAGTFGCLLGLSPPVTAITFVALGTSLPDTFASKQAAEESESADASIGNVTGSNSVNVFLGLGLPWTILAVYKSVRGLEYKVKAGGIAFSVIVFCACAIICIAVFFVRRFYFGGELGGPTRMKQFSAALFLFLWLIYVVLSSLRSENVI